MGWGKRGRTTGLSHGRRGERNVREKHRRYKHRWSKWTGRRPPSLPAPVSKAPSGPELQDEGAVAWEVAVAGGYALPPAGLDRAPGDTHLPQEAVGLLVEESDLIGACVGTLVV